MTTSELIKLYITYGTLPPDTEVMDKKRGDGWTEVKVKGIGLLLNIDEDFHSPNDWIVRAMISETGDYFKSDNVVAFHGSGNNPDPKLISEGSFKLRNILLLYEAKRNLPHQYYNADIWSEINRSQLSNRNMHSSSHVYAEVNILDNDLYCRINDQISHYNHKREKVKLTTPVWSDESLKQLTNSIDGWMAECNDIEMGCQSNHDKLTKLFSKPLPVIDDGKFATAVDIGNYYTIIDPVTKDKIEVWPGPNNYFIGESKQHASYSVLDYRAIVTKDKIETIGDKGDRHLLPARLNRFINNVAIAVQGIFTNEIKLVVLHTHDVQDDVDLA